MPYPSVRPPMKRRLFGLSVLLGKVYSNAVNLGAYIYVHGHVRHNVPGLEKFK